PGSTRSRFRDRNGDIAELQAPRVVSLYIERTWVTFVGTDRAARDTLDFLMVYRHDAIARNGDRAAHQHHVECFPLARRTWQHRAGPDPSVDRSHGPLRRFAPLL